MRLNDLITITYLFAIYKSIQFVIIYFVPCQFDTSSTLLLASYTVEKSQYINNFPFGWGRIVTEVLEKFVIWDNVYFSDLFVNEIKYEHQFVFCPLWWRIIKYVNPSRNFYSGLCTGVAISNLTHYFSCIVLYYLTLTTFKSSKFFNKEKLSSFALKSSCIYILSPAGVFLTASYSEAPCALLSYSALLLREISLNRSDFNVINSKLSIRTGAYTSIYVLSGTLVAIAYNIRANSLLLGIIYLYDLYTFYLRNDSLRDAILSTLAGSQLALSIVIASWYPYSIFCTGEGADREWCHYYIPSIFSYAQSHYWNIGFLSYWTPNNIPNFILPLPTIILTILGAKWFTSRYPFQNILPIILVNIILLIGGVFWWHTQILTRISTFLPLMYWYVASLDIVGSSHEDERIYSWTINYFIIWGLFQTALFGAFLPPA
ncbi:GPI mannosyltransferase 2 [[Candida] railenensis]|uniref:GPI mannosyltransferase 2 n=1 Tax=[Candida] railenensis TaxID=45579 RepID=A0A9P0QMH4_9ASCO|nr:GPI mannosyltransferase 2 [[Candida] railenensis]